MTGFRRIFASILAGAVALGFTIATQAPARAADRAMAACTSSKVAASIAGCTTVIKRGDKEPLVNRVNARYNRGNAYFNKGDLDRAIADYREAIALAPEFSNAHFNLGNAYSNKRDLDRAIAEYSAVIRIDRSYTFAYYNRGNAYFNKGEIDKAIADYGSVIALDPKYIFAYINRGNGYRQKGEFDRAFADYAAALKLDPKNKLALANRDQARSEQAAAKALAAANPPPPATEPEPPPVVASDEKRVALVIGNSDYAAVEKLANPPRDAAAVADALKRDGFASVTLVDNVTRQSFLAALNAFSDKAADADWAVVYFAGHGIEMDGINYLIPIDARLRADRDVQDEAIPLDRVISAVERARQLRLVVLDACRNNPFVPSMKRTGQTRAIHRGLARVEPAGGTLVAFAAKGGQEAVDGEGSGSPFATALVERLRTPGLEIGKLFRLVRDDVLKATDRQQEPFVYGSLPGEDLYFQPARR